MNEKLKCSGRTTKLLFEAIKLWMNGEQVCVVLSNFHDCEHYKRRIDSITSVIASLYNIENRIIFITSDDISWNWGTLKRRGSDSNTKYLIDHSAIEKRFETLLTELHRFDPK